MGWRSAAYGDDALLAKDDLCIAHRRETTSLVCIIFSFSIQADKIPFPSFHIHRNKYDMIFYRTKLQSDGRWKSYKNVLLLMLLTAIYNGARSLLLTHLRS